MRFASGEEVRKEEEKKKEKQTLSLNSESAFSESVSWV